MIPKINLLEKANSVSELFQYLEVSRLNNHTLNVLQAENRTLDFHIHEDSDELFYVIECSFAIEFEDGLVSLNQGDLIVVPKGTLRRPVRWNEFDYLRTIKPTIPLTGDDDIPLQHEIELEILAVKF